MNKRKMARGLMRTNADISGMKAKKIWIFGGVGSGKTTFAEKLSEKLKIPFYTTENFVYEKKWGEKCSESMKRKNIQAVVNKPFWIIEGTHNGKWIEAQVKKADVVILLNMSRPRLFFRVTKRHIARKKSGDLGSWETLIKMLRWAFEYKSSDYEKYKKLARGKKFIILNGPKQVNEFDYAEELK